MRRSQDTKHITEYFGRDIASLSDRRQRHLRQAAFEFWRARGFPFPTVTDMEIAREVRKLRRYTSARLDATLSRPSTVGLTVANAFHPEIWDARVRGKSPLEVFDSDTDLRAIIARAPRMRPNRRCWNAAHIRMLTGLHNRSRVANFRPTVARVLAARMARKGDCVVDFCAGYGGRYFGIATLERSYLGIDVSRHRIAGLEAMSERLCPFVSSHAAFLLGAAEVVMKELESKSAQLVISSPPYFRLEKYDKSDEQCWRKYTTYDEWLESFLAVVVYESVRVLRPGGYLAINVADLPRFPIAEDCATLMRQCARKRVSRRSIHMSTNPNVKGKTGEQTKAEPLLIVRR